MLRVVLLSLEIELKVVLLLTSGVLIDFNCERFSNVFCYCVCVNLCVYDSEEKVKLLRRILFFLFSTNWIFTITELRPSCLNGGSWDWQCRAPRPTHSPEKCASIVHPLSVCCWCDRRLLRRRRTVRRRATERIRCGWLQPTPVQRSRHLTETAAAARRHNMTRCHCHWHCHWVIIQSCINNLSKWLKKRINV